MMEDYSYDPMTEEQAQQQRYSLLPDGEYDAVIEQFEGKISSSGNRMIEFVVNVYDRNGNIHAMKDFIAFTPKMTWKLRHHCVSAGLQAEFENKTWRPHMSVGKGVKVKIAVQAGKEIPADRLKGKAPGAMYPDRNVIDDYLPGSHNAASKVDPLFSDDVPF